jgi:hypothetical protein
MASMVVPGRATAHASAALVALALAVSGSLVASSARADEPRVGVLPFSGPGAGKARGSVVATLRQHGATVVDDGDLRGSAEKLGADLSDPAQRSDVSRMHGVDAWIDGKVSRERGQQVVELTVTNGADGETLDTSSLGARNINVLARLLRKDGWGLIEPSLQRAHRAEAAAAVEPEPEPVAEEQQREPEPTKEAEDEEEDEDDQDDQGDEAEDDADDGERPSPLRLELSVSGLSRVLAYRENLDRLPGYKVALPPSLRGLVIWYPAAHFASGVPAHLGLRLHGQYTFGVSSKVENANGPEFSTSSHLFEVGLRARIPLDTFELGASFSYGLHGYAVDSAKQAGVTVEPGIPSIGYSYLHVGAELRMQLGDFALAFGGAVLPLLGVGDLEDWFPRASGLGIEGSAELGYAIGSSFDLFAMLSDRRYAVTFDPRIADLAAGRVLAGGAVDNYLHALLGVRFTPGRKP